MSVARKWLAAAVVAVALGVSTALGSCSSNAAAPVATLPDANSPAAKLFIDNCARCHGVDAMGQQGAGLRIIGTNVTADTARNDIVNGVPLKMPSFKGVLSDADINTLVDYSVRLGQVPAPTTAP